MKTKEWERNRVIHEQIKRFAPGEGNFISEQKIDSALENSAKTSLSEIRDIIQKSLEIKTLSLEETASLLNVQDKETIQEMEEAALKVKKKVYDNRIVTFAPLYTGNYCVNRCLYCGFRSSNRQVERKVLSLDEIRAESEVLAGEIGHKRLIAVYGEHPAMGIDYICDALNAIYGVKVKARKGFGQIRRINVNAPPLSIEELEQMKSAGIGTYQVFQETYHKATYNRVHPYSTIKSNYKWRLYVMHRAMEAGIDDVGLGALFGLYDWRFEVMGLAAHNLELENSFGVGAHTISFPRIDPAIGTPYSENPPCRVSDSDFRKIITVIRLAVPHTGLIVTAREAADMRMEAVNLGITQTDASTRIGIGAYSGASEEQEAEKQQFILGDTRSLDEMVREFARMGYITSFCTAGYRCNRTGKNIMECLRSGREGNLCKLNAVLTFREWIDDFASGQTREEALPLIEKEIHEIKSRLPGIYPVFMEHYSRIKSGERDIYF